MSGERLGVAVADQVGVGVRVSRGGCGEVVGEYVRDAVAVPEGVELGVGLLGAVGVLVLVAVAVGTVSRVRVGVADLGGTEGVAVRLLVAVEVGDCDGVVERVGVSVAERLGVPEGVRVGVTKAEYVAEGVEDAGASVRVVENVRVNVGATDVLVGIAVNVGRGVMLGGGGDPTRTIISAASPKLPRRSRTRTVTNVSPVGNARDAGTSPQNCTVPGSGETNRGAPNSSTVHAPGKVTATPKPQLPS